MAEAVYDTAIRGGVVIDGAGSDRQVADIAIKNGCIAAVGALSGRARKEIDASGLLVTPGFVDIHTHYDGQATWAERMQPSSWHGVTTVVMGNCGVGFAPCRPGDRERLIRLMEGVEDIPNPVLSAGLPWNWQSFPEYLDALEQRHFDVDIGVQLAHSPLRVFAMGERGANREAATDTDIAAMAAIAKEAMLVGALGFSTSRTINHKSADGNSVPSYQAAERELVGIAMGLKSAGRGVLQLVTDFDDPQADFAMIRRLVEASGRPLSFSLLQRLQAPQDWKQVLEALEQAGREGLPIRGQVPCRPVGLLLGLEASLNPFAHTIAYREIGQLPLATKVARMRDASFRARLEAEIEAKGGAPVMFSWDLFYPLDSEVPDYEPGPERTIAAEALRTQRSAAACALDHLLRDDGRGLLYVPVFNYSEGNLEVTREMMLSRYTILGLSDGGAHMGVICDGSFPTTLLAHWTRDRRRGAQLTIEEVVKMQTYDTASAVGLHDRGLIRPGLRADLNLIDHSKLKAAMPEFAYDLPAGGRHLVQRAEGYRYTMVAGRITYRDGTPTGMLPGRLLRGSCAAPPIAA